LFAASVSEKREAKLSCKKSALYQKIMREHNLPIENKNLKLNYNIERIQNPLT